MLCHRKSGVLDNGGPYPLSFKAKEQGIYGVSNKNSSLALSCMASNQASRENYGDPNA